MSLKDYEAKEEKETSYKLKELKIIINALEPIETIKNTMQAKENKQQNQHKNCVLKTTSQKPFLQIITKQTKNYSIWHEPTIYLPLAEKTQETSPDFIFINEKTPELYELGNLKKQIQTHEKLSDRMKKELSQKLLKKMKKITLLLFVKKKLTQKELKEITAISSYLKPKNTLVIIEDYLKPEIKIAMPSTIKYVENAGMNKQKTKQEIKQML